MEKWEVQKCRLVTIGTQENGLLSVSIYHQLTFECTLFSLSVSWREKVVTVFLEALEDFLSTSTFSRVFVVGERREKLHRTKMAQLCSYVFCARVHARTPENEFSVFCLLTVLLAPSRLANRDSPQLCSKLTRNPTQQQGTIFPSLLLIILVPKVPWAVLYSCQTGRCFDFILDTFSTFVFQFLNLIFL